MPECAVNGVRLHYEERGSGEPILCIHGAGSSSIAWRDPAERLARLGRVVIYDRRGWGRSERPEPYERTSVVEQSEDAAGLLEALDAASAVVVGRSYGGWVATELALRHPDRVRALALLEPDVPGLEPAADAWVTRLGERLRAVAARSGVEAVAEALISEAAGPEAWRAWPEELRRTVSASGAGILADVGSIAGERSEAAALARLEQPVLLVAAADSPPEFRAANEALAAVLPDVRTALVEGGHLIDPADAVVLDFVAEALAAAP